MGGKAQQIMTGARKTTRISHICFILENPYKIASYWSKYFFVVTRSDLHKKFQPSGRLCTWNTVTPTMVPHEATIRMKLINSPNLRADAWKIGNSQQRLTSERDPRVSETHDDIRIELICLHAQCGAQTAENSHCHQPHKSNKQYQDNIQSEEVHTVTKIVNKSSPLQHDPYERVRQ